MERLEEGPKISVHNQLKDSLVDCCRAESHLRATLLERAQSKRARDPNPSYSSTRENEGREKFKDAQEEIEDLRK